MGDVHGANASLSRRHKSVDGSEAEKVKPADVSVIVPDGPESMTVLGRVVSGAPMPGRETAPGPAESLP